MISLIIPTYNPQDYIFECLDSVINQNIPISDFEILIILNGSSLEYKIKLEDYLKNKCKYNIKLIYTKEKGVSIARNIGIDHAKGDFIAFIDDDDIISDNYLMDMQKNAKQDAMVVSNVYTFKNTIQYCEEDYISQAFKRKRRNNNKFYMRSFFSSSCCKLIPKSAIGNKRFNPQFTVGEDSLFMASISNQIKNIYFANKAIYYRRIRDNSASRKEVSIRNIINNAITLSWNFFLIYISNPYSYNFLFFLTRYIAPFKRLFLHKRTK